jgi:hypothetical protein
VNEKRSAMSGSEVVVLSARLRCVMCDGQEDQTGDFKEKRAPDTNKQ